jgi:hypothetical protein
MTKNGRQQAAIFVGFEVGKPVLGMITDVILDRKIIM